MLRHTPEELGLKPSSAIHSLGYDSAELTLEVVWRKKGSDEPGQAYHFSPVSDSLYAEILAAPSLGARINVLKADASISQTLVAITEEF